MWKQIRKQAMIENRNRKMLRGNYVMFVFGFLCLLSCGLLVPADLPGEEDALLLEAIYGMFLVMGILLKNGSMTHIMEDGKRVNVFQKLTYVPVNYTIYIGGKLYLIWKEALIIDMVYQGIILAIRMAAHLPIISPIAFYATCFILFAGILDTIRIFFNYFLRNKSDILV